MLAWVWTGSATPSWHSYQVFDPFLVSYFLILFGFGTWIGFDLWIILWLIVSLSVLDSLSCMPDPESIDSLIPVGFISIWVQPKSLICIHCSQLPSSDSTKYWEINQSRKRKSDRKKTCHSVCISQNVSIYQGRALSCATEKNFLILLYAWEGNLLLIIWIMSHTFLPFITDTTMSMNVTCPF